MVHRHRSWSVYEGVPKKKEACFKVYDLGAVVQRYGGLIQHQRLGMIPFQERGFWKRLLADIQVCHKLLKSYSGESQVEPIKEEEEKAAKVAAITQTKELTLLGTVEQKLIPCGHKCLIKARELPVDYGYNPLIKKGRLQFHNTDTLHISAVILMSIEDVHDGVPGLTQLNQYVVKIPKTNEIFRLLYTTKVRFKMHSIRDKEPHPSFTNTRAPQRSCLELVLVTTKPVPVSQTEPPLSIRFRINIGAYIVRNTLHYQDLEWYDALKDCKLKEEALKNKAIIEGMIDDNDELSNNERCKLFDDHELPICTVRRFEMIKYSFRQDEEYVAIKEDEYEDLTSTCEDACRAYQKIFRMMDEGWMDLAEKKSTMLVKNLRSGNLEVLES
ncbi:VIER F-box protein 2 [Tanacetum coccineum]